MTDELHRWRLTRHIDDLRAFLEHHARIAGQEAHELLAVGRVHGGAGEGAFADEVGLRLADRPGEADIVRRDRAVGVLADDDEAFLGAQHMHGLGAVGREPERLAGFADRVERRRALVARDIDLEAEFAGETDAEQHHRHAAQRAVHHRHVRQRGRRDVEAIDERRQQLARARTLHCDHRPLLGGRGQPDIEIGPLGLPVVLHHREHARGATSGRRDMEPVFGEPRHHTVVVDETVVAQQDAVLAAAHRKLGPIVDIEAVHEGGRARTCHHDLAERRGVEHAAALAHCTTLTRHGGVHILARAWEEAGTLPHADILEHRALAHSPAVHGRAAHRVEDLAACLPRETREGDGRVGHAEGGEADRGNRFAESARGVVQGVDVRGLALVGRHAGRRVALDVLDGTEALAHREVEVLEHHIVLEIDEGLGAGYGGLGARQATCRGRGRVLDDLEAGFLARAA